MSLDLTVPFDDLRELFKNHDFRALFLGRLVTNAGDSLYAVASMWLVYSLSGSTLFTGVAAFLTTFPRALQFLVGPLVDRWPLRRVFVLSQVVQAVLLSAIPIAHYVGILSVHLVLVVMPLVAIANQFVYPAQNAALPEVVDESQLVSANSAFSFAFQGSDLTFRGIAGFFIGFVGIVSLFIVDIVTFVFAALIFMTISYSIRGGDSGEGKDQRYVKRLSDGISYVRGTFLVWIMIGLALVNTTVGVSQAVLPAFADIQGGAGFYGLLLGSLAAGTLIGALVAPLFQSVRFGQVTMAVFTLSGLCWITGVYIPNKILMILLFTISWISVGILNVNVQSLFQTTVPNEFVGRVTSISVSASFVMKPFGSLFGGLVGEYIGVIQLMTAASFGFFSIALIFLMQRSLRVLPTPEEFNSIELNSSEKPCESVSFDR